MGPAVFRRAIAFVSALAAHAATVPEARAADPAQLDCILRAVPDADRAALERTLAGQDQDEAAEAPIGRALEQCRRTLSWSDEDAANAFMFAVGALAQSESDAGWRRSASRRRSWSRRCLPTRR